MRYKLEIKKEDFAKVVLELRKCGYKASDYMVSSYRPDDLSDCRGERDRTVTLDDGTRFIQPRRKEDRVLRFFETENEGVINIVYNMLYEEN